MSDIQVWDKYWQEQKKLPDQNDAMSFFLAHIVQNIWIKKSVNTNPRVIEVGAGSGSKSRS